ncbi:DegT/DnrJ/EryC1/StrS family aminotransferase [Altibacter sp. HG106]|uniref:DegT/DnrJ/EryC1/StrS family aminotransferase n=1 Tax=Altibacter sp. HG106 TaxID=3023937 RepID=UPI002350F245|nr:aminotransferase class I/II-fold pyridoxal phosphate-dependent enzyme [Altibacter sp. HG106]MDC7995354.1 aminotransferase class I/II-fold pyridoxal phosphate-dependent enzyme [Altibacter sp. HG106]
MSSTIYLSSPHMGGTEEAYVKEAFDTNWIAPLGPNVNGFEAALSNYLGHQKEVAALSSGTAALHLALALLEVGSGDEVMCQSMTFAASANPIIYQGANPVFVDSEPATWNMCPNHLEAAITDRLKQGKRPKAVIAVHLYGMPCKIDDIRNLCKTYDIPLIEDAAEALGSTYQGVPCGTFGDFGVLSFNGNKIITTSGGGALVCASEAEKQKAVFLATQARDEAPHYQHSVLGYNYRLSNIAAGIGRGQMEVLDTHIGLRQQMNQFYKEQFFGWEGIEVFTEPNESFVSNHWLSCITIDKKKTGFSAEELRKAFGEDNIEARPLWKPMHLQPLYENAPYYGGTVAQTLFENGLCLPSGSNLTDTERSRIAAVIRQFR